MALATLVACGPFGCGGRGSNPLPDKVLNIYSWADYIAPDTVANFERETGIKVNYTTYESNEILETHLLTGHTNYDIVLPTDVYFERLLGARVFRPLDQTILTNRGNLDPGIMRQLAVHDPGNRYATPYLWTTVGIGYNIDMIRARLGDVHPESWSLLFDPANAAKLQDCGITVIDSPMDVFAAALLYLGKDPNSRDSAEVGAAADLLMKIRPYVRSINSSGYLNELANGGHCLVLGWSGDVAQARLRSMESGSSVKLRYFVPREGSLIVVDMMAIPADAPHPHNAQIWLNYLMRPEVMAGITNAVSYPNGNLASFSIVKDAIRSDPTVFPDSTTRTRLHALVAASPGHSRLITRLWTRFRERQ